MAALPGLFGHFWQRPATGDTSQDRATGMARNAPLRSVNSVAKDSAGLQRKTRVSGNRLSDSLSVEAFESAPRKG